MGCWCGGGALGTKRSLECETGAATAPADRRPLRKEEEEEEEEEETPLVPMVVRYDPAVCGPDVAHWPAPERRRGHERRRG
jgi:hypothetical protein